MGDARPEHFHNFRVVNGSLQHTGNGSNWTERCRCGSSVVVEQTFRVGERFAARMIKTWFDRYGNVLKVTGTNGPIPPDSSSTNPPVS